MRKGVTSSPHTAGTTAALNQVTQGPGMTTPSSVASFRHSRFWAAAVRNMAEECTEPCIWACTRNLPSFLAEGVPAGSGSNSMSQAPQNLDFQQEIAQLLG